MCGVVGAAWRGLTVPRVVVVVSRTPWDGWPERVRAPVGENRSARLGVVFPSSSGLVESAVNLPGPPGKPKYSLVTDSARVP